MGKTLAAGFDYKLGEFPLQFLHMPIRHLGHIREDWLPTIQKVDRSQLIGRVLLFPKGQTNSGECYPEFYPSIYDAILILAN